MSNQDNYHILQNIFKDYFKVSKEAFLSNKTLEELHPDFKQLGYLLFLEQVLTEQFNTKIPLIENIISNIHTPRDIEQLINKELNKK